MPKCKKCHKQRAQLSRQGLCAKCSNAKAHLSISQMRNKEGKAWELWKKGMLRFFEKVEAEKV